ncbi:MAG: type II secretion system protein [Planctomycetota bacterium]
MYRDIRTALTLAELMVTLMLLSIVSALAIPALRRQQTRSQHELSRHSMSQIRTVIRRDYREDLFHSLPYPMDPSRPSHPQLKYLYHNPAAYLAADPESIEATSAWSYDPSTRRGWSGPYIDHASGSLGRYAEDSTRGFEPIYGSTGDPAPLDGWGNPIVLQQPVVTGGVHSATSVRYARLVSAGPDGILSTPPLTALPSPGEIGDDIVSYLEAR